MQVHGLRAQRLGVLPVVGVGGLEPVHADLLGQLRDGRLKLTVHVLVQEELQDAEHRVALRLLVIDRG